MVADVQGWLDGTLSNFGWLLKNDDETVRQTFRAFYTAEGALEQNVPQFAPELTVSFTVPTPTPEPSSLGLMALAAFSLFALRRRSRG